MGDIIAIDRKPPRAAVAAHEPDLRPSLAVIVPTLNEADNIVPLLAALDRVLTGYRREIIFVDDWSDDGTPELVAAIARNRTDVRLIRRFGRRGLSSAVIEGMMATTMDLLAVIDADLQHDEALLPRLCALVEHGEVGIAVGSRYVAGGSVGKWCATRQWASRAATRLAELAMPVRVADPMSGFFVLRRETFQAAVPHLSGAGFKLLLDIILSSPATPKVAELPYAFRTRNAGTSKLGCGVMAAFARLLIEKSVRRFLPMRLIAFGLVGLLGVGVHLSVLRATMLLTDASFARAQATAVVCAIAFNFLLNNRFTFRDRTLRGGRLLAGLGSFYLICGIGAVGNVGVAAWLFAGHQRWWLAGLAGAIVGSVWNFAAASAITWRKPAEPTDPPQRIAAVPTQASS